MLSDVTFFLNDHINQRNVLQTLKKIQNIADNEKQSYTPIVHAESKVETDELGHIVGLYSNVNIIKSNYTFQEWNNIVLGKQSSEFTYQKFPCFYVGKHYIQNNPIELYKKLLDLTLSDSYMNEEELYLNKSWKHLLK
jgi:hypothetical protein